MSWSPSREELYLKNVHATFWHADERIEAGIPRSWGVAATAAWTFDKKWMVFSRAGWSEGEAPFMNKTATLGFGRLFADDSDTIGMGFNWGDPSDPELRDQVTLETFFKLQVAEDLAVTPSFQLIIDPAQNPDEDRI